MTRFKRVAVLGAGGLLGSWLGRLYAQNDLLATGYSRLHPNLTRLDLTDLASLEEAVRAFNPDLVYLTAALTDPGSAERDKDLATRTNTHPPDLLARLARELGFRLVFISTDLVFDGRQGSYTEPDIRAPLSHYGRTKARAEDLVLASNSDCLVVRTSLIIGADPFGLAGNLAWFDREVRADRPIKLFTDEYRSPVAVSELAGGLAILAEEAEPGLYHLAGPERLSRYELGRIIFKGMNWPLELLRPGSLVGLESVPPRAPDVSLDQTKAAKILQGRARRLVAEALLESINPPRWSTARLRGTG